MRLDRTGQVNWGFHAQISHAVLHDFEIDGYDAGHLNGATERDFAVALREMEIAN